MIIEFLESLENPKSTDILQKSIKMLCELGRDIENSNKNASYYLVQSMMENSVSLLFGDIRSRNSYSNIITIRQRDDNRVFINTVNFDSFDEDHFEISSPISKEIILRCLNSNYNRNIIKNLYSIFKNAGEECTIQVRTGIFWSDKKIPVPACQLIFKGIGLGEHHYLFDAATKNSPNHLLTLNTTFLKQTNQISINGIKFKAKIKKNTISLDTFSDDNTVKFFR